jgi:hypothetical protein
MYQKGRATTDEPLRQLTEVPCRTHLASASHGDYCASINRYCDDLKQFRLHFAKILSAAPPKVKPLNALMFFKQEVLAGMVRD